MDANEPDPDISLINSALYHCMFYLSIFPPSRDLRFFIERLDYKQFSNWRFYYDNRNWEIYLSAWKGNIK
jgi:hypothetical protein